MGELGTDLPLDTGGERTAAKLNGLTIENPRTVTLASVLIGCRLELVSCERFREMNDNKRRVDGVAPVCLDKL